MDKANVQTHITDSQIGRHPDHRDIIDSAKSTVKGMLEGTNDIFTDRHIDMSSPSLKDYINRVIDANMGTNTNSIKTDEDDGIRMMQMLNEAEDLISCMTGIGLHYSIDGAIGLSLRQLKDKGKFIRRHRDVDLIMPKDEIYALNQVLHRQPNGRKWGIFIWNTEGLSESDRLCFSPIHDDWNGKGMLQAIPIDEKYEIDTDRYGHFTMIDIHYLESGDIGYTYGNRNISEKDIFSQTIILPGGTPCPVVSIEQLAINKSCSERGQDRFDLMHMIPLLDAAGKIYVINELSALMDYTFDVEMKRIISQNLELISG